jgi:hypothetical protein
MKRTQALDRNRFGETLEAGSVVRRDGGFEHNWHYFVGCFFTPYF